MKRIATLIACLAILSAPSWAVVTVSQTDVLRVRAYANPDFRNHDGEQALVITLSKYTEVLDHENWVRVPDSTVKTWKRVSLTNAQQGDAAPGLLIDDRETTPPATAMGAYTYVLSVTPAQLGITADTLNYPAFYFIAMFVEQFLQANGFME
jgi:hypothetical protein